MLLACLAIADDSGLEVAALGGAPGIHAARWGGPAKDFNLAMQRVQNELEASGQTDRRANFTCALAVAAPGADCQSIRGQGVRHGGLAAARNARFRL